jgi:hypothetical protein
MLEVSLYQVAANIRCHDDYRVFEVNRSAFIVSKPAVIQHL